MQGKVLFEIEETPVFAPVYGAPVKIVPMPEGHFSEWLARSCVSVIGCATASGNRHAVAWDGQLAYDPAGSVYTLEGLPYRAYIMWGIVDFKIKGA